MTLFAKDVAPLETVRAWRAQPTEFDPLEHEAYCDNGMVTYWREDGSTAGLRCPVCDYLAGFTRLRERMLAAGIGSIYLDKDWDSLAPVPPFPHLKAVCARLDEVILQGHSLLLHGESGQGKTQAAVLIAKEAIKRGYSVAVENLGQLSIQVMDAIKGIGEDTMGSTVRRLQQVDLLVLDDLGAGEGESLGIERRLAYLILEGRQKMQRPTVATTNLELHELGEMLGARTLQRLEPLKVIRVNHGTNFRLQGGKSAWDE